MTEATHTARPGGLLRPAGADTTGLIPTAALTEQAVTDLGLDRLFDPSVADAPWLADLYRRPCADVATIRYRQAIAAELTDPEVAAPFESLVSDVRRLQQRLQATARVPDPVARHSWFLAAAERYVACLRTFQDAVSALTLRAQGLVAARDRVVALLAADRHQVLVEETTAIRSQLDALTFTVRMQGGRVTVDRLRDEPDLAAQVSATFGRFRMGTPTPIEPTATEAGGDRITARILELVAAQHPEPFARLGALHDRAQPLVAPEVEELVAELPFYLGVLPRFRRLADAGLPITFPDLVGHDGACQADGSYDLAVGMRRLSEGEEVVPNSWWLEGHERIMVVTGANQGGKTTFARAFAQLHHLSALGLPVPARSATVGVHDRVRTHFERQEQMTSLRGKLQDELERLHELLAEATEASVIVLNETFSSTTLADARTLGRIFLDRLARLGARVVYVTFVDELAGAGGRVVSMVAGVAEDDPTRRTFRIERRPPDGLAHAMALADSYGLSEAALRQRFAP